MRLMSTITPTRSIASFMRIAQEGISAGPERRRESSMGDRVVPGPRVEAARPARRPSQRPDV